MHRRVLCYAMSAGGFGMFLVQPSSFPLNDTMDL